MRNLLVHTFDLPSQYCFHKCSSTGGTSKGTQSHALALDYIHSVSANILNVSVWISWSKPCKSKWTAEDYLARLIWKILALNKIWKLDKKNSWYLSLLSKLDLHFIFGSKAEANCSISIKLLCQLLVSSSWAMLRKILIFLWQHLDVSRIWKSGLVFQKELYHSTVTNDSRKSQEYFSIIVWNYALLFIFTRNNGWVPSSSTSETIFGLYTRSKHYEKFPNSKNNKKLI